MNPTGREGKGSSRKRGQRAEGSAEGGKGDFRGSYRVRAAYFKAVCLRLMDRVKETGAEYVITKRGRPVAKLAPITGEDVRPFVNRSRGVIEASPEAVLAPIDEDWEVDADL